RPGDSIAARVRLLAAPPTPGRELPVHGDPLAPADARARVRSLRRRRRRLRLRGCHLRGAGRARARAWRTPHEPRCAPVPVARLASALRGRATVPGAEPALG